ncbi:hypothetical protein CRUP_023828 [Coryphaenoides rupestris]|nr:hypothetical protein CRUP_023828 [Coryphaenoides rupestris]
MFFFYFMIVPPQRGLFLWVRQNIKLVIYATLLCDRLLLSGHAICQMAFKQTNGTHHLLEVEIAAFSIVDAYMCLCLCVMMFSCFATVHYLRRNMRSLVARGGSLFSARLRNQVRVTVMGIVQGVLYMVYGVWFMVMIFGYYLPPLVKFNPNITFTVISLYISITTVNLGVGQTLFRERALRVWKDVKRRVCAGTMSWDPRSALATVERPADTDVS